MRRESIKAVNDSARKREHGLTVRQGTAISQLKLMLEETPGGVSLKSLAQRLQMTVPATSLLVENMVTKGYMVRNTNPDDRRSVCILLTDKGESLFMDLYARFHNELDRRASKLTQEELTTFASIVEKMQS
ncbi:MAG: MarR family transcriptional regulator [Akkermansia sp.]|nr:MarR family transcriptional regulator [Akkermansia sp.]MBR2314861.1 MarR family transcriptional regulator [Akkermansia sp.]